MRIIIGERKPNDRYDVRLSHFKVQQARDVIQVKAIISKSLYLVLKLAK